MIVTTWCCGKLSSPGGGINPDIQREISRREKTKRQSVSTNEWRRSNVYASDLSWHTKNPRWLTCGRRTEPNGTDEKRRAGNDRPTSTPPRKIDHHLWNAQRQRTWNLTRLAPRALSESRSGPSTPNKKKATKRNETTCKTRCRASSDHSTATAAVIGRSSAFINYGESKTLTKRKNRR